MPHGIYTVDYDFLDSRLFPVRVSFSSRLPNFTLRGRRGFLTSLLTTNRRLNSLQAYFVLCVRLSVVSEKMSKDLKIGLTDPSSYGIIIIR